MANDLSLSRAKAASILVRNATVRYGPREVLTSVTLDVRAGEFVCLLGPSGCGKTTLLNAIAGFIPLASGEIGVDRVPVRGPGGDRGMVFQEYALFPWFTVFENVVYGPKLRRASRDEQRRIAEHYLSLVKLEKYGHCYPNQLSGGQRQRVALARALANQPSILLMDEPFGALDAMTRESLQQELLDLWQADRRTCIFVTHSVGEAAFLAETVVVMKAQPGRIDAVIANASPRPRDRTSDAYFSMYRKIDAVLRDQREPVAQTVAA
jgi:ABC-type nitrate/sulfonate/bicarbonate transport system ATPase subunit